nr:integrase, catalytic region, zinc finger, CCHC-type, peptidase aspartic, catalytic [Tanacetum cinerariifolium]
MSTQQDIYVASLENRPLILNKDNYVSWSSRIIRYARSRPNGKMIVDSIKNGPYVRRMIATLGEPDLPILVLESFHKQTDEEQIEIDIKRMDVDDQAIETILLGLPKDVYAAVDSCETAKEIWERVRQMTKGSDIEEQEKKAMLFNEWEKFMSSDGESIESYYHHFMQLMNDLKRNKNFPENIALNLKFLNNLQPVWKRHVTIVSQTKNLHEADFTQIYDFLKINRDEVNKLRVERLAKSHDPLALMAHSQNSFNFPTTQKDQSSSNINDPTEAMNFALILFAKAFQLIAPTNNNQRTSSNPRNRQIAQPVMNMSQDRQTQNVGGNGGNQFGQYAGQVAQNQQGIANQNGTGNVVAARGEGTGNENQARIQLQAEEFDLMAAAGDLDKIEEVNANCILIANLQHVSTSGTQLEKALVYDTDGSAEVQLNDNCYDNEIFNMFTQKEQYTDLLKPIPEPQLVPQNDNHVTFITPSMVQSGGTVETSFAPNEETRVFVLQTTKSEEELFLSNVSNMVIVSKMIYIPNEDLLDDTPPSVKRLQAQLRDLKGKNSDTLSTLNTLDPLNQKLESKIVELKFQVAHAKLHDLIYENAQLRARVFENTSESMKNTSGTSVTPHIDKPKLSNVAPHSKKLHASTPSHSVPQLREFNVVKHRNVISPEMFKINLSQTPRVDLVPNKQSSTSIRTNPITNSQRHVIVKKNVSSNTFTASSTGRNTCFIRDLDGVDLLKGNHSINLYTINLDDMASASPICLMARATHTKSWLWYQRLSHLNFDTGKGYN